MTEQRPLDIRFIDEWFLEKSTDGCFDETILSLIDQQRDGATLDEDALLKGLMAISEKKSEQNATD